MTQCEMCSKRTTVHNTTAMGCDAILCRACINQLRKESIKVVIHNRIQKPQ